MMYPARAAGVLGLWALGVVPPMTGLMRCPSAMWFHHACPGCGMTRAVWLLAGGDVAGSLAMHPLAVPSAIATLLVVVAMTRWILRQGTLAAITRDRFARVAIALFVLVNAATVVLWITRSFGALGGLPPV